MANSSIKSAMLIAGAGAFALTFGIAPAHSDETIIEKHTAESHSYKVEENAPAVEKHSADAVIERTEETTERIPPPAVVEKRTTVETVPAAPVVQRRTSETVHTEN